MRVLLLVWVTFGGCTAEPGDCLLHSQCATAQRCIEGRCVQPPPPHDAGRAEAGPVDAAPVDTGSLNDAAAVADIAVVSDASLGDVLLGDLSPSVDATLPADASQPALGDAGLTPTDGSPVGEAGGTVPDGGPARG